MKASPRFGDSGAIADGELLQAVAQHNQDALAELYRRYGNLVYSMAFHTLQNTVLAEEVTQDVFLKIWAQPSRWTPDGGRFSSWLLTVTRYTAIDRLRREGAHLSRLILLLDAIPDESSDGASDDAMSDSDDLRVLLEQLPTEQAQVIQLAFFRGMTHQEMAKALDLPLGTVKTRLRAGLSKLKCMLTDAQQVKMVEGENDL